MLWVQPLEFACNPLEPLVGNWNCGQGGQRLNLEALSSERERETELVFGVACDHESKIHYIGYAGGQGLALEGNPDKGERRTKVRGCSKHIS